VTGYRWGKGWFTVTGICGMIKIELSWSMRGNALLYAGYEEYEEHE